MSLIYCVTNKLNGRIYVGKTTKSLRTAWAELIEIAQTPTDEGAYFTMHPMARMIRLYGPDSFTTHELERMTIPHSLIKRHKAWIQYLGADQDNYNAPVLPADELRAEMRHLAAEQALEEEPT
jgi:hypothetical protein